MDLFNQLSARRELGLDVGGEVFLPKGEAALNREPVAIVNKRATNLGLGGNPVGHELVARSLVGVTQLRLDVLPGATDTFTTLWSRSDRGVEVLHTEPLKVRKVFSSSSSDKIGWRATKLMNLPSARLLPSMNSRSETLVRTADRRQRNTDQGLKQRVMSCIWCLQGMNKQSRVFQFIYRHTKIPDG